LGNYRRDPAWTQSPAGTPPRRPAPTGERLLAGSAPRPASRFLKASSSRRYESGYGDSGYGDLDRSYAREPLYGSSSRTSPYDTSSTAGYGTEASYAPVSEAPVGGTDDPDPVQGGTLHETEVPVVDAYDERRS
jgi:hypothetical protein